ncbi:MAG: hypothetical protein JWN01_1054 [Patescibacteria group bacterium]|nr:hypothetical protein [Patescibacteria group bacterium]
MSEHGPQSGSEAETQKGHFDYIALRAESNTLAIEAVAGVPVEELSEETAAAWHEVIAAADEQELACITEAGRRFRDEAEKEQFLAMLWNLREDRLSTGMVLDLTHPHFTTLP